MAAPSKVDALNTSLATSEPIQSVDGDAVKARWNDERIFATALAMAFAVFLYDRGLELLFSPLRFDENLTGWVTSDGLGDAVSRSWNYQGQSPVYFALSWAWQQIVGSSEIALRLPSLFALGVGAWQLIRIGRDLHIRTAGYIAAVVLVSSEVGAMDARPYVFLVLSVIVSIRMGVRWAMFGRRVDGALWAVAGALALYFQPLAIYAFVPHVAIVVAAIRKGWAKQTSAFVALGGVLLIPLVPQLLLLRARQDTLVISPIPDLVPALVETLPPIFLAAVISGVVVDFLLGRTIKPVHRWFWFFAAAMVTPAIGVYLQTVVTGDSIFVARYYRAGIPAAGLAAGVALSALRIQARLIGSAAVVVFAAFTLGAHPAEDWYFAADVVNETPSDVEVWAVTGLIESTHSFYFENDDANDYLSSAILWHGAQRPVLSIPLIESDELTDVHLRNVERVVSSDSSVVIIRTANPNGPDQEGPAFVIEQLESAGYVSIETQQGRGVRSTLLAPS